MTVRYGKVWCLVRDIKISFFVDKLGYVANHLR